MIDAKEALGSRDVLFVTFDTLRFDVAERAMRQGQTPTLARLLPGGRWEKRHSPGSFTYSAHHAFFAGFLPTPSQPGTHERLFALRFPGSETCGPRTCVFDASNIIDGFAQAGYHTACVGGVGFFNKLTPLGCVLPSLFAESHWRRDLGVTIKESPANQFACALKLIDAQPLDRRLFVFVNLSAMHRPNSHYLPGATRDTPETQGAALAAVDVALADFVSRITQRDWLCVFCSDHGEAYGEDDYAGHRLAHEVVWTVPYAEFLLGTAKESN